MLTPAIAVGGQPRNMAISPNGQFVYSLSVTDSTASVIATATNTVVNTITVGTRPEGLTLTLDGKYVYVTDTTDGTVSVIDTATNKVVNTIAVGTNPTDIRITPDDKFAYVTNRGDNTVSVMAIGTTTINATLPGSTPGASYTGGFTATDPVGSTFTYSATGLPPGMSINPTTGAITGTAPTTPGNYPITVTVTATANDPVNGLDEAIAQPFNLAVLPAGTGGTPYAGSIAVPNDTGAPDITCTVSAGSLPPGTTLTANTTANTCDVSGTPTSAGTYTFSVTTTSTVNGAVQTNTQPYTIVINATSLPGATAGVGYTDTLPVPHDTGTTFTCTVSAGTLPLGLTLNQTTCELSGTPTTPGNYNFTITSNSTVGGVAGTLTPVPFTLVIRAPAVASSIPTLSGMALVLLALLLGASAVAVHRRGY